MARLPTKTSATHFFKCKNRLNLQTLQNRRQTLTENTECKPMPGFRLLISFESAMTFEAEKLFLFLAF